MAKRKAPPAGASGKVLEAPTPERQTLNRRQERFIDAYILNGGERVAAALDSGCPSAIADSWSRMQLRVPAVIEAIRTEQQHLQRRLRFGREDALRMYIGMAKATLDDFRKVLINPENEKAYVGLGDKIHALKGAKKSYKNGNSIELVDKKAVIDGLWEKLGLGKEGSSGNWFDGLEQLVELVRATKERKQ